MRRRIWRWVGVVVLLALPVLTYEAYVLVTAPPDEIVLASGSPGGRYRDLGERLARAIESRTGIRVALRETSGSLENLHLVERGEAQLGLYQGGTLDTLGKVGRRDGPGDNTSLASGATGVAFVANLYEELVLLLVRSDLEIASPYDLAGKRVNLGVRTSGDHAVARLLAEYYRLSLDDFEPRYLRYDELREEFARGTLDASFMSVGPTAPVLESLLRSGEVRLVSLPHREGLIRRNLFLTPVDVAPGFLGVSPRPVPGNTVAALGVRALLVASASTPRAFIDEVTRLVLDKSFARRAALPELFRDGERFARASPDFPLHPGALQVFEPGLRPLLNPDFVEATEGMRSFIVSILIAAFLLLRWLGRVRMRRREHRLDRYIRSLLEMERMQVDLDANLERPQVETLEVLLDKVTSLRQEALGEFTAHELSEDRGPECFIAMSHALSDKIAAKLLRYRIDRLISSVESGSRG